MAGCQLPADGGRLELHGDAGKNESGRLISGSFDSRSVVECLRTQLEMRCAPGSALPSGKSGREPPHSHTTCTTQFRFLERVASKIWSKQFASCIRNTDFIGLRGRLNTCGEINGVAPQVIGKPPFAYDARDDWS